MPREDTSLSFDEYFWKDVDLDGKVLLDAGTGFGVTTSEIAKRILPTKRSRIISVDIDSESLEQVRKLLSQELKDLITFIRADLSSMPEISTESVDVIISTRTLADINSIPCRLTRALVEFRRILKPNGRVVLSDECPVLKARSAEESVAVARWQLAKAISHIVGGPHANEIEPEDVEFTMKLTGFKDCRWAVFAGEEISERRINRFVERATEMTNGIEDLKLKNAFSEAIVNAREMFKKRGGVFPPRYILHANK
jgi:ubiquinone/menaquinone biosynthesis C-methylase UbiE